MKAIYLFFLLLVTPVYADGIRSSTKVTPENLDTLDFHSLSVETSSQPGLSCVGLRLKTKALVNCEVTVYSKDKKTVLTRFNPSLSSHPANPIYFYIADSMLDQVEVQYTLYANKSQVHMFTIEAGQLTKIAKKRQ